MTFEGVHVSGGVNLVAEGLESFYDWSDIMQIIVSAVEEGGSTDDMEDKVSEELSDWLTTLQGSLKVVISVYPYLQKTPNFSRFYKKLGPFYKKLRCDKFGN